MSDASGGRPAQQMGHGVKQRDVIRMTDEEVDAFIHERRPMTMCTLCLLYTSDAADE